MTTETESLAYTRPFAVHTQGDFHVEYVNVADRRPTLRRWYLGIEEKRSEGYAYVDGRHLTVLLSNRMDGEVVITTHPEGQTGENHTLLTKNLPRTLPWRHWVVEVEPDKWGVEVIAWTSSWPRRPGSILAEEWYRFKKRRRDARRA